MLEQLCVAWHAVLCSFVAACDSCKVSASTTFVDNLWVALCVCVCFMRSCWSGGDMHSPSFSSKAHITLLLVVL